MPHCRICYFQSDLILLDLKKDKYHVIEKELASKLIDCLSQPVDKDRPFSKELSDALHKFQRLKILSHSVSKTPEVIPQKNNLPGANVDWRIERHSLDTKLPLRLKFKALGSLIWVYMLLYCFGFYRLILWVQKKKSRRPLSKSPYYDVTTLSHALNQACFYFPIRVKCLEWATAYTLLALRYGWECTLNIGVQNQPFSAHAWAEVGGSVIADNPLMSKHLPVILQEGA